MRKIINWGIIGLGNIAHKFAQDLALVEDAILYAVASRDGNRAESFGKQYAAHTIYNSYKALAEDPNIDVVYIATPHRFHHAHTMLCLNANKAVLCEKAFAMDVVELEEMISTARAKQLFLMEALWTRFIPGTLKVLALINEGSIGKIQRVKADFGFIGDTDPEKRLFNKQLGGGALLDIGIYPVFLSVMTLGEPKNIMASAILAATGVDKSIEIEFEYESGQSAVLEASLIRSTPTEGWIQGEKGTLKMHRNFHHTKAISLFRKEVLIDHFAVEYVGNGYYHEIEEVMQCLKDGKIESEKMSHSFSLALLNTLDRVREKIGLYYKDESIPKQ